MKIAIIGSNGVVGSSLASHFEETDHDVFKVDQGAEMTIEEVAKVADAVFVATLPLKEIPEIIMRISENIGHGKLIVNCASIQQIKGIDNIPADLLLEREVTLCHLHFHFTPSIPLERSLFGKNVTVFFSGSVTRKWSQWLKDQFVAHGPFWHEIDVDEHDSLTDISQLNHMITTPMMGAVWSQNSQAHIEKALRIGGPPQWLNMSGVLRASLSPRVVSEILCEHPHTLDVIKTMRKTLDELEEHVTNGNVAEIAEMVARPRALLSPAFLEISDRTTDALIEHESSRRVRNTVILRFSHEQDVLSLRSEVLAIFEDHGVSLTAILPEKSSFNGMVFRISFESFDSKAEEAVAAIRRVWNLAD